MKIGKVLGTVVATRKNENLVGFKIMVVQPLDIDLKPKGDVVML